MSTLFVSINNQLFNLADARILITDLALQRGYGIFDFLKTVNGRAIFMDDYLDRFYNSAKEMNLEVGLDRTQLLKAISTLTEANNIPDSGIKIILTGGYSEDGYQIGKPNLIINQTILKLNTDNFENGIKLITYNHQRQLPQIKTIDYLQAIRLQPLVKAQQADDILYHHNGLICECPRSNFFLVTGNEIITPKSNILRGITRKKILAMDVAGYTIKEQDFTLKDISHASEAFITSSTKNVQPVSAIDGHLIGTGKAGKVSHILAEKLNRLITNYQ